MLGKKYSISASKLISGSTKDNDNYFCSELVASIYKFMNILPQNIPSTKYWPSILNYKSLSPPKENSI
jgi:hypothetical protein